MAITYCNTTSDLTNAYYDIERYKGYFILDSTKWALHSGNIYKIQQSGYIEALFEDGVETTEVSTLVALNAATKFFYDSTADILYYWATGDVNPNTLTMEKGVTWTTFKETCRNDAQEMIEGWLRSQFVVPFRSITAPRESYNSRVYDHWIIRATALATCYLILKRLNPNDSAANKIFRELYNDEPEPGESKGIIQMIKDKDFILKIEESTREPGAFNVYEKSDLTATAFFIVTGKYTGTYKQTFRVQIDTAGAPGTATWKISNDGGSSWDKTEQETLTSGSEQDVRISIDSGLYIEFVGTFSDGDYIDIECFPLDDLADTNPQFSSVTVAR